MEDHNMGTGYCTYTLHSNPNRAPIVVPEEYDRKANDFMKLTGNIESKRKDSLGYELLKKKADDILYFTYCNDLADDEVRESEKRDEKNGENSSGLEDAIHKRDFFIKILESI